MVGCKVEEPGKAEECSNLPSHTLLCGLCHDLFVLVCFSHPYHGIVTLICPQSCGDGGVAVSKVSPGDLCLLLRTLSHSVVG